jgi:hypothetical protein
MEVLGDLKKEAKGGKLPPADRVRDFARKLFPVYTIINTHYKNLIVSDLLGNHPSLDGRPNVNINKAVISESGMKGQVVSISKEEESIYKWKDGDFSSADHELSQIWRTTTTQTDLLENFKEGLISSSSKMHKFKDFNHLNEMVTRAIESIGIQENLLKSIIELNEIDANSAVKIFSRWHMEGGPLLKDFAPYAYYCLKVDNLFMFGLTSGFIPTRPTNRVDCEYLHYLPFCDVFTSNDKLHKNLVPFLLRSDQKFIIGEALKQDMSKIHKYFDGKGIEEKRMYKNEPPIIEDSITFQLWKEFFDYPKYSNLKRELSKEEVELMKAKMDEFEKAAKGQKIEMQEGEEVEFIVKQSYLSKDDPCFCGSGKKVIDCCIPLDEFKKLSKQK